MHLFKVKSLLLNKGRILLIKPIVIQQLMVCMCFCRSDRVGSFVFFVNTFVLFFAIKMLETKYIIMIAVACVFVLILIIVLPIVCRKEKYVELNFD